MREPPAPLEYANPTTPHPSRPPKWYQPDVSGMDVALTLTFIVLVILGLLIL